MRHQHVRFAHITKNGLSDGMNWGNGGNNFWSSGRGARTRDTCQQQCGKDNLAGQFREAEGGGFKRHHLKNSKYVML